MNRTRADLRTTKADHDYIVKIANRVIEWGEENGLEFNKLGLIMDLSAVHLNGNPLMLATMATTPRIGDLIHDVVGIRRNLDRETGKLKNLFSPRFTETELKKKLDF